MLLALEALFAHATDVRPLGTVAQFMSLQVLFTLQTSAAYIADVPSFDFVHRQMLFQIGFVRKCQLTFGTAEKHGAIGSGGDMYLAGLWWLRLWRLLFVLSLFLRLAVGIDLGRRCRCCRRV